MKIDQTTIDATIQLLRHESDKVAANIIDINTNPKKARVVTLKLTLTPNERNREDVDIDIAVGSTLAAPIVFRHSGRIVKGPNGEFILQANRSIMELVKDTEGLTKMVDQNEPMEGEDD